MFGCKTFAEHHGERGDHDFFKGELYPQTKIEHIFVCYLKIINTFLKLDISILKKIIWETQKWH